MTKVPFHFFFFCKVTLASSFFPLLLCGGSLNTQEKKRRRGQRKKVGRRQLQIAVSSLKDGLSMYLNVKYQSNERRRIGLYRIFILHTSSLGFFRFIFIPASTKRLCPSAQCFVYCVPSSSLSLLVFRFFILFYSLPLSLFVSVAVGHETAFAYICTIHFPHRFRNMDNGLLFVGYLMQTLYH